MLQSRTKCCTVILRPKSIWSRLPPPTATNKMLQGEHFNKQLQINLHHPDIDTLLTHTKFHHNSTNCYKYIQLSILIPVFQVVPLGSYPCILSKSGALKLSSSNIKMNVTPLCHSGMTKPKCHVVTCD